MATSDIWWKNLNIEHWILTLDWIKRGVSAEKFQFEIQPLVFIGSDDHWWDIDGWLFELIEWQWQVFNYSGSTLFGIVSMCAELTKVLLASIHSIYWTGCHGGWRSWMGKQLDLCGNIQTPPTSSSTECESPAGLGVIFPTYYNQGGSENPCEIYSW